MPDIPVIRWIEGGQERSARWRSERGAEPPAKVVIADDRMTADEAYGLAAQGVGLLWRGDFQNARQMLKAMASRFAKRRAPATTFNSHRQSQAQRSRTLGMLLIPLDADYTIPLRRGPDVRQAASEVYGRAGAASVVSLREIQGVIGAHEWRRKGMNFPAIGGMVHPHYGVFAPVRNEYVDLVAKAPLPAALKQFPVAFDIGTGTGVLAAVLAHRGVPRVVATDIEPRALACARENIERLRMQERVEIVATDLFPPGRAALVVCNPPWVPARPSSPLEHGIYDPESRMLRGFLQGLAAHLEPGGEGWLILSDLAEHLGLRTREELVSAIQAAGLTVAGRIDARPKHPKAADEDDPLHQARMAEMTSLWRLT